MKIKLAILEKDTVYLQRIVSAFNNKYADKLEIYSFTEKDMAIKTAREAKINVLLAGEEYQITPEMLPERCAFAWFVDTPDVENINQCHAICKFQKIDLIYKQIISLYSEVAGDIVTSKNGGDASAKVISFLSPAGGVGCSTAAAAGAMFLARMGKRVLYLNLEKYGSVETFFQGMGQGDLSDMLYAIKSQKSNLALKLEGIVKQDKSGVCFLSECKIVLDRLEMKKEDVEALLTQIQLGENYDHIILDSDFSFDSFEMEVMRRSDGIVLVSNGSQNANMKIRKVYNALGILEQQGEVRVTHKMMLLYNRFHSQTGETLEDIPLPGIGGIQNFKGAKEAAIAKEISKMDLFTKLL